MTKDSLLIPGVFAATAGLWLLSMKIFGKSKAWKRSSNDHFSTLRTGEKNGTVGSRGQKALSPPIPYLGQFLHCLSVSRSMSLKKETAICF